MKKLMKFSPLVALLASSMSAGAAIADYDAAVEGSGFVARLTEPKAFDGLDTAPATTFNYGALSGDATIDFILRGDPEGGGRNGFIGVGSNALSSLRYEQWDNTGTLGFTQGGVADYNLGIPSPTQDTLVTYRWSDGDNKMDVFINGIFGASQEGASDAFVMPSGDGFLGSRADGAESMLGVISRVTTYDSLQDDATIAARGAAFAIPEPSGAALTVLAVGLLGFRRRR